jgi:hypothetical protein
MHLETPLEIYLIVIEIVDFQFSVLEQALKGTFCYKLADLVRRQLKQLAR